jgi:hypothetical protein
MREKRLDGFHPLKFTSLLCMRACVCAHVYNVISMMCFTFCVPYQMRDIPPPCQNPPQHTEIPETLSD